MKQIEFKEVFRFAHGGHTVRSYGPGLLEVGGRLDEPGQIPNDAAEYAAANKLGIIKDVKDPAPGGDDAELTNQIKAAIVKLDLDNDEHWTKDGKPQVAAIEAVLGKDITAGQRDQVWALMNP